VPVVPVISPRSPRTSLILYMCRCTHLFDEPPVAMKQHGFASLSSALRRVLTGSLTHYRVFVSAPYGIPKPAPKCKDIGDGEVAESINAGVV